MVIVVDAVVDVDVDVDGSDVVDVDVSVAVDVDVYADVSVAVDVDVYADDSVAVDVDVYADVDGNGVDIVVVTFEDDVVVVMVSGFDGGRMTNFNNRERVTAIIARNIREMPMILNQR
jgi:hypothetical protein